MRTRARSDCFGDYPLRSGNDAHIGRSGVSLLTGGDLDGRVHGDLTILVGALGVGRDLGSVRRYSPNASLTERSES